VSPPLSLPASLSPRDPVAAWGEPRPPPPAKNRPWLIVLVLLAAATATLAIVVFAMTHLF
jgi:hypothetical protein